MSELKKINEAISELRERKSTSTEHIHCQSLVSDVKKLNQTVTKLAESNTAMQKQLHKMAEEKTIPRSRI